jgi:diguanylate cyclase (GGDEF)-like protein/PAS domain S-box-containing protein
MIDTTGGACFWNSAAERMFGYARQEALGKRLQDLLQLSSLREDPEPDEHATQRPMADRGVSRLRRMRAVCKDGSSVPVEVSIAPACIEHKWHLVAVIRDITALWHREEELERHRQELHRLATRDELTGVYNRRHFLEHFDAAVSAARRHGHPLCLCMCDLDWFKQINDTYGHQAGDNALREFGRVLRENLRQEDVAGRYGGDEFCLVLPHTAAEQAQAPIDRVVAAFEKLVFEASEDREFSARASFGLAELRPHMTDAELWEAADRALYRAKAVRPSRAGGIH